MIPASTYLNFVGPSRTYFGSSGTLAIDGEEGSWGLGQNYWNQDAAGKWYPDSDGTVLTEVILSTDNSFWYVAEENQYALDSNNKTYKKYGLIYSNCKLCPFNLTGNDVVNTSGVATWTEYDENENILDTAQIPWAYGVQILGTLMKEVYFEKGILAYWKETILSVARDISLNDLLTGVMIERTPA